MAAINHQQSFLRSLSSIRVSEGRETPIGPTRRSSSKRSLSSPIPASSPADPICVSDLPPLPFGCDSGCDSNNSSSRSRGLSRRSNFQRPESILRKSATNSPKRHKARSSVSFLYNDDGTLMTQESTFHSQSQQKHRGLRKDYSLGKRACSSSHMIIESDHDVAFQSASSLKNHDFAFVKRSDGQWTYAILAYRSFELVKNEEVVEECMMFVMSDAGSTKLIKKRQWGDYVRLVSMKGLEER